MIQLWNIRWQLLLDSLRYFIIGPSTVKGFLDWEHLVFFFLNRTIYLSLENTVSFTDSIFKVQLFLQTLTALCAFLVYAIFNESDSSLIERLV